MALKPASIYGNKLAVSLSVPPGSSQTKHYVGIANMVLEILADADVIAAAPPPTGFGVTVPPGTVVPVLGKGKIV